ncbi:hypothetical protein F5J12DRAFT_893516 [Pisolithus orientalis]|uniref:uncharacterized protein n=1 Tax=Pisolithus orientalis TaxID=936130 RepID=UPI0022244073|nr:uncharacterized protein F5J12DRAFT_893516 [Pisolithus orientalis]KAI6004435.1 hypothetical protein F5J12DRAFT_893516 [Pisolithus orientalis]
MDKARLMAIHFPEASWVSGMLPSKHYVGSVCLQKSIFDNPHSRVSATNATVLLLTVRPHHPNLLLHDAMIYLQLDDLIPALGDFISSQTYITCSSHCFSTSDCSPPFQAVNVWGKFQIQHRSTQDVQAVTPTQMAQAVPPSERLPFGCANTVLVSHESGELISADPQSKRYLVAQVQAILQPICNLMFPPLIYVKFFNFSNLHYHVIDNIHVVAPALKIEMFLVQQCF